MSLYDVTAFGADPTGTTDASPGIQAALDAAFTDPGSTVLVPPGTYLIGATVFIGSNTTLVATGAHLVWVANVAAELLRCRNVAPVTLYNGEHDWTIDGGTWDGNRLNVTAGSNIFAFSHCKNVVIRNVTFTGLKNYHCIELNASQDVTVQDCVFRDSGGTTEAVQIDGAFGSGMFPWFGVWDSTACDRITIERCVFKEGIADAIGSHTQIAGHPHTNITIRDCEMHVTGYALKMEGWQNVMLGTNRMACDTPIFLTHDAGSYVELGPTTCVPLTTPGEPADQSPPTGGPEPMHVCFYTNDGGSGQMSNAPATALEVFNNAKHRVAVDLTGFTQGFVTAYVSITGGPVARLLLRHSTDGGTTWADAGPEVGIGSIGSKEGAWINLSAAIGRCILRLDQIDGNGVADPAFGSLHAQFR